MSWTRFLGTKLYISSLCELHYICFKVYHCRLYTKKDWSRADKLVAYLKGSLMIQRL